MGKSAVSGPFYGAKSLLWSAVSAASTGASTIALITVPPGEDWIISDVAVHRGSTGSTGFIASVNDDSTVFATVAITSSLGDQTGSTRVPKASGEYTGYVAATGSVLGVGLTAGSSAVQVWVYGFQRWLDTSTLGFGPQ